MQPSDSRTLRPWAWILGLAIAATVPTVWILSQTAVHAENDPPVAEGVLAVVGGVEITEAEVREQLSGQFRDLENQRHQLLEQGMEQLIAERLLDLAAQSRGISRDELMAQEVEAKVTEPTDAEVDAFYEERKAQINAPKEQIAPQIREYLGQMQQQELYAALVEDLRGRHAVRTLLEPLRTVVASDGAPAFGPADAPVTIVEFSDFQCPFCSRVLPALDQVKETYGDRVRIVFRQFPLLSIHPQAQKAAEASLCAADQDKFWEMHDTLFREQQALGVEQLKEKAARLELDSDAFNDCLDSSKYAGQVATDLEEGTEAGVTGTPALFVNGRFLSGAQPYEQIAKLIDDELKRLDG